MNIVFNKGELKYFNDINQEMKNIFKKYQYNPLDISGGYVIDKFEDYGIHFAQITNKLFDNNNQIVNILPNDIFQAIKDDKKNIIGIKSDSNNDIFLYTDTNQYLIGSMGDDYSNIFNHKSKSELLLDKFKSSTDIIELSDDDTKNLIDNKLISVKSGNYSTKITKGLIPGLKKTHQIIVGFYDADDDDNLFKFHIMAKRATNVITHHVYTCIYM